MEPERWRRLNETFDRAINLPPTERERLLDDTAANDPDLAHQIRQLLAIHDSESTRLSALDRGAAAALFDETSPDVSPSETRYESDDPTLKLTIGPYRILREIGRGGMGAVYLARRDDGAFDREVAIKLVKRGMDGEEIVRRFLAERRILASLIHPNIARLLDGGTTADGRPFFVLEYVDGRPITQHCAETQSSVEERLRLFLDVCSGVETAHRNLIVHRDLKPANILVDRAGVPKLLDFGIAKLLSEDEADPARLAATALGARPMTPDYASPEQVEGAPITTAADVWGLGVLLYELLVGRNPAAVARHLETGRGPRAQDGERGSAKTSRWEIRPPSVAVRALADRSQATEYPEAEKLARRLRGDLDLIVGKALAPEPERRYGSARELAEDLRRHLEHRPVVARRPTVAYRLGRAIRRHKLATAAGITIVLLAVAALVGGVVAVRQRLRAEQEAERARGLSAFLIDLFKVSDPDRSRGEEVPARALLDAGARRLGRDDVAPKEGPALPSLPGIANDPTARADLLEAIGEVYANLGLFAQAETTLRRTLALRRRDESADAELRRARTETLLGRVLIDRSDYREAEAAIRRGLTIRERQLGHQDAAVAESLSTLGELELSRRDFALAEKYLIAARDLLRRQEKSPAVRQALTDTLSHLTALAIETEHAAAAASHLDEQLKAQGSADLGDLRTAENLSLLAALLYRQGDLSGAETRFRQSLALREKLLDPHHPDVVLGHKNLAAIESELGHFEAAERSLRQALAEERTAGPLNHSGDHSEVADTLTSLSHVLRERGQWNEALQLASEAAGIYERLGADQRAALGNALNNLGVIERDLGDFGAAERLIRRGLVLRRETLGAESPAVAVSLNSLGGLLHQAQRPAEAEAAYREALALRRRLFGENHLATAASMVGLGALWVDGGRSREALALLEQGLAVRKARLPAEHPSIATAESALGACYGALGRNIEAHTLLEKSVRTLTASRGPNHPETRRAEARLLRLDKPS